MSRPLRIELENAYYHVTARGNRRNVIFRTDSDRLTWLDILAETCERFDFVVLAYCQMGNHYHLVLQTRQGHLSRGMRFLNGKYSQYFNRQHRLVGHLFQGRYNAVLCQGDAYLRELSRYTELNPVRARLVSHPGDWIWSSYAAVIGKIDAPPWLARDAVLGQFDNERSQAIRKFEAFVLEGIGKASPFDSVRNQLFYGNDEFCQRAVQHQLGANLREINRTQRQAIIRPLADYFAEIPNEKDAIAQAYLSRAYTMSQIAEFKGISIRTVCRAVSAYRKKMA
jgi:REP element-mobilizing transposase RayT